MTIQQKATTGAGRSTIGSAAMMTRARQLTPGGVNSNVRMVGNPIVFERGKGAWLWDVDGNDYVDYLLGQGPNFLGHAPDFVQSAVSRELTRGSVFGAQHVLENDAAEIFLDTVGWADRVRFGMTGTESDQAALRLARAATGRTKFVRFAGTYHGWLDNVLMTMKEGKPAAASAGQMGAYLEDSLVIQYNDIAALTALLADYGSDIAAIIVEPVMCNSGAIPPRDGYLAAVRALCDKYDIVLIFDEVITGFRVALGGAAERYGVTPDLAVYGKALAGGWPVSAIAGKAALLDLFATGNVNHSGTFNASIPACAAVIATLTMLRADLPYARIEEHGSALMTALTDLGHSHGLPLRAQGLPMSFHLSFGDPAPIWDLDGLGGLDLARYARLASVLVEHGVWVTGRGIWYVSAAHGGTEFDAVLERADNAFKTFAAVES